MKITLYALQDFLDSFHNWNEFKKSLSIDSESWTYEQGIEENELYETMLMYWEVLNNAAY